MKVVLHLVIFLTFDNSKTSSYHFVVHRSTELVKHFVLIKSSNTLFLTELFTFGG